MDDDFCTIHGYGFMRRTKQWGVLSAECTECERLADVKRATIALKKGGSELLSELKKELQL